MGKISTTLSLLIAILFVLSELVSGQIQVDNSFYPSYNGEGDFGDIMLKQHVDAVSHPGPNCLMISYSANKSQNKGWAEISWLYPGNNWGDHPGRELVWARLLTFWARGEKGGEKAEFRIGGIKGIYPDSLNKSTGIIILSKTWNRIEIDLSDYDRSSIIGGFRWITNTTQNPNGSVIYLDDLIYQVGPKATPRYYFNYRWDAMWWKEWRDLSKYFDILLLITCGFGVRPEYTITCSLIIILIFGFIFWKRRYFLRRKYAHSTIKSRINFIDSLYVSARIFFTHNIPSDWGFLDRGRYAVLIEDILGWFLLAIFIVTLGKVVIWFSL